MLFRVFRVFSGYGLKAETTKHAKHTKRHEQEKNTNQNFFTFNVSSCFRGSQSNKEVTMDHAEYTEQAKRT